MKKKDSFGTTFGERVVKLALSIPEGRVTTYGALARAAGGGAMASQSITSILSKAEQNGVKGIPYHRIIYSDGRIWVDDEHRAQRMRLYKKEGVKVDEKDRVVDFEKLLV